MKVIVSGKDNRRVECSRCKCIYEYDDEDVRGYLYLFLVDNGKNNIIEYVVCPECGEIAILHRQNKRAEITEDDYSIRAFKDNK